MLDRQNLKRETLRESLRNGMRVDHLVAQITENLKEPADEEARKYYQRHPDEFATSERVHIRHILVRPESAGEQDRAVARSKLEGLKSRIEAGADFESLAREHSECESGEKAGGLLGWISRGTTQPEFDKAVFELAVGGRSAT